MIGWRFVTVLFQKCDLFIVFIVALAMHFCLEKQLLMCLLKFISNSINKFSSFSDSAPNFNRISM